MDKIKKILVALDASHMDNTLIPYTKFLLDKLEIEKLYFVSVIKNLNVPDEILEEHPDFITNAIKDREESIREVVKKSCPGCEANTEFIVKIDQTTRFIMEFSEVNDIDLIVLGRKLTIPTSAITIPRLARRANTNLLIVPEGAKPRADRFLVPTDFSLHSKMALQYAFDMVEKSDNPSIVCQHVYGVPAGYHYTGKSHEEFAEIMLKNAEKNFNNFIESIEKGNTDTKLEVIYDLDDNEDLTSDIKDAARTIKPDWVIIGAKGRTRAAALFIGSFAEKLIQSLADIPLFVARPKGGNEGLIDYLKEL